METTTSNSSTSTHCISFQDVLDAYTQIQPLVHRTPLLSSYSLNTLCDNRNLFFKVEAMQRTGSFKFRGACNATLALVEKLTANNDTLHHHDVHVVTHSSGNHAAAVALAADQVSKKVVKDKFKIKATIVMPKNAPTIKVKGVRAFGGEIVMVENTNEAREEKANEIVEKENAKFIHPSENEYVIAGQGTVCLEMVEQLKEILGDDGMLDAVIIPVGGGGLASGNTIALRGLLGNKVKIILAEPAELNDAKRSKDAGKLLGHYEGNQLNSCADGLKTTLGKNTWPIVRDLVDDIFLVSEVEILSATKLIWERLKVMVEPNSGVGVAVALGNEFREKYSVENGFKNVGIVLCGGNVDVLTTTSLMTKYGIE